MTDSLEIPTFLKRTKEPTMPHIEHTLPKDTPELGASSNGRASVSKTENEGSTPSASANQPDTEITLEMILEQIKKLSAKRDEIQATLSGLKKQAQKMIGGI